MSPALNRGTATAGAGLAGLSLTLLAGVLQRSPDLTASLVRAADLFVSLAFRIAVLAVFCLGFVVIAYSVWHQRHGTVDEERARWIALGVASVLALSLFFPLVVLDDLFRVTLAALSETGVDLPETVLFLASVAVFGSLTVVGTADAVRRRRG